MIVLLFLGLTTSVLATQAALAFPQHDRVADAEIRFGFDNLVKLGSWTPVFMRLPSDSQPKYFEVKSLDSDGIPVNTIGTLISMGGGDYQAWTRMGRTNGSIEIRLLDEDKNLLKTFMFSPGDKSYPQFLASTQPLIVTVEPGETIINSIKSASARAADDQPRVLAIHSPCQLPATWIGYQGVDTIVLSTADSERVNCISDRQLSAIRQWIMNGGSLIFCAGQNSAEVLSNPDGIAQFLPGKFDGPRKMELSSRVEFYAKSTQQLIQRDGKPITVAGIVDPDGMVELQQDGNPLVIRKSFGFGQIVFSAINFDMSPVNDWAGQKNFLNKLLNRDENLEQSSAAESRIGRVSHPGYRDMSGQLLLPLEQFSQVGFVTFTWVAVLIVLYILCIGPGDYFFLRKIAGRMEYTWITFTLITLVFCGLAFSIARLTRPKEIQINQLEIIDVDAVSERTRGNLWANIFSPSNGHCDITAIGKNVLGFDTANSCVTWQGLPGNALGGMQSKTIAGLAREPYFCEFQEPRPDDKINSRLLDLPIQVSSTKTLFVQWWSANPFQIRSRLILNSNVGRLQGTFTNPFDIELRNCRLMFENWAYVMDQPLGPGQTVDVGSNMRERTAVSYLTRRVREKDKGANAPWNPLDPRMHRIADILMFFRAAGGSDYTGLSHGYQPFVDLSDQMKLQRAVLVGETDELCTKLKISGGPREPHYDQHWTYVRIVLPVEYRTSSSTK